MRRTADGTLVLFHDPILDWASGGHGRVHETGWDEIAGTRIDGEPIPTLAAGLSAIAAADADVDLCLGAKRAGHGESILDLVEEHGLLDRVRLTSFEPRALAPALRRGVSVGFLGVAPDPELIEVAATIGAASVSGHYVPSALSWFAEEAHERGLTAGIRNLVETQHSLEAARNTDPDFITTNRPDLAVRSVR